MGGFQFAQSIKGQHGIGKADAEPYNKVLVHPEFWPMVAKDKGGHTEQGGHISEQGDISGLQNAMNPISGDSNPARPDYDHADTGKVGPTIIDYFFQGLGGVIVPDFV